MAEIDALAPNLKAVEQLEAISTRLHDANDDFLKQTRAAKEIETVGRDVAKLSSELTTATSEQAQSVQALVKDADEVRRIAKQTARAVGEQSDALAGLAQAATRQMQGVQALASSTAEHAGATEQVAVAMRDIRTRTRDVAGALANQAKAAAATTDDVAFVVREIAALRVANGEQAELVSTMTREEDPTT